MHLDYNRVTIKPFRKEGWVKKLSGFLVDLATEICAYLDSPNSFYVCR